MRIFFPPGLLSLHFAAQMHLVPVYLFSVNCFHSSPKESSPIHAVSLLKVKPISDFIEICLHSFGGISILVYWFGILVCCAQSLAVW